MCREPVDSINPARITRTLSVQWSDSAANYRYYLNIFDNNEDGERRKMQEFNGDKAWAERLAEHYNIKMPKIEGGK